MALAVPDALAGKGQEERPTPYEFGGALLAEDPGVPRAGDYSWVDLAGTVFTLRRGSIDGGDMPRGYFDVGVAQPGNACVNFTVSPSTAYASGPNAGLADAVYGARYGDDVMDKLAVDMEEHVLRVIGGQTLDEPEFRRRVAHWYIGRMGINGSRRDTG